MLIKLITLFFCCSLFAQKKTDTEMVKFVAEKLSLTNEQFLKLSTLPVETEKIYQFLIQEKNTNKDIEFALKIVNAIIDEKYISVSSYSKDNYPGKNEGLPFEWWLDEKFLKKEFNVKQ